MDLMFWGYIASIFVGFSLGFIGGGGSILALPILVYIFRLDPVSATAHSLFIVGVTSAIGSVTYFKRGLIDKKTFLLFGGPSIVSVFVMRAYILPIIPEEILSFRGITLTKSTSIMVLFACLMIAASYSMIRKSVSLIPSLSAKRQSYIYILLVIQGIMIGLLVGMLGAGGGFLIIPALVLFYKLAIKTAIGTSLAIITTQSLLGFMGGDQNVFIHWDILLIISFFSILGIVVGVILSKNIDGEKLKPAFGWFILAMGIYIMLKQIISF